MSQLDPVFHRILIAFLLAGCDGPQSETEDLSGRFFSGIEEKYLHSRTTVALAEKEHAVTNPQLGPEPVAFGFMNRYWVHLKSQLRHGDELWNYSEPGGTGICIVREKYAVRCLRLIIV
jgi:hypothetical protein